MEENVNPVGNATEDNNEEVVLTQEQKLEIFKEKNWSNLEQLPNLEILNKLKSVQEQVSITQQKPFFEEAKDILSTRMNEAKTKAKEAFLADGGDEKDFEFKDFDYGSFQNLYGQFRDQRNQHFEQKKKNEETNLVKREEIINELKGLVDSGDNIRFDDFKRINDTWKELGNIPVGKVDGIYKTYSHHVERFFDLLNLNHELRDIEFNRNLKFKTDLCEKAENLAKEENTLSAVNQLQDLHRSWKMNNGPVPKEQREAIWERFSAATQVIHDRRTAYYQALEAQYEDNFQAKLQLVEKVKNIDTNGLNSHQKWQEKIKEIDAVRAEWNTVGRISKEQNEISWNALKDAIRDFNNEKNTYYKNYKKRQQEALDIKYDLLRQAEELKESTDWKNTSNALKNLQKKWKSTPRPLLAEADEVWSKFRESCNFFFNNMNNYYESLKGDVEENLKQKEALIAEVENITLPQDNAKDAFALLKDYNQKWRNTGQVSKEDYQRLDSKFRSLMDSYFNQIKMDEDEKHQMILKLKIDEWLKEDNIRAIEKEKSFFKRKIERLQEDIRQYDRNLEWFSGSKNNPLFTDVQKKIDRSNKMIISYKKNIQKINDWMNAAKNEENSVNE
jgi:hypothetical protein